ncbi:MAG: tRNA (adenosine(37)-N6)-dimethylallyltransferase MiaA [Chloroflexota bacterium]
MLAGATATGKTRLALEVAEAIGAAEIISADSRQVYRGMDIGTAKATYDERARVPHHGLDLADPDEPFTAADFLRHAHAALAGIAARGRLAILAGGTGLYLRAVARGVPLDEAGHDPALRAELDERLATEGLAALAAELIALAPGLAGRTDLANPRRVVRALERAHLLGDRQPPEPVGYAGPVEWLGTRMERSEHDRVIAGRAREQFDAGLLEETAALRARYRDDVQGFSGMGYHEAMAVLDGRWDRETAIEADAVRTRRYARRQETWFRAEPGITWLDPGEGRLRAALDAAARLLDAPRPAERLS